MLIASRLSEDGGELGSQVPVVGHERPGQRRLAVQTVAKAFGEIFYPVGVRGPLRVREAARK